MSRTPIPYHAGDLSALSRSLIRQLTDFGRIPGHVEMLNLLARAAGFRNYQSLHASHEAQCRMESPAPTLPPVDFARVARLRRYFDTEGCLQRWPGKFSDREPCLWVIWSRLPHRRIMTEREVNEAVKMAETIGDHVLLRRQLIDHQMLARTPDGREYHRVERKPPAEAMALLRFLPEQRS